MTTTSKQKHRSNIIVVSIILVVVAASFLMSSLSASPASASTLTAIVHDGEGETYRFPLDVDTTATIETELGYNIVTVKSGSIQVTESNCKNHDCMRQGSIHTPGQRIICLPHEFYIEVIGVKDSSDDASAVSR